MVPGGANTDDRAVGGQRKISGEPRSRGDHAADQEFLSGHGRDGHLWIDGAKDFLAALTATGRKYCFMTNNSSKSASIYVEKLLNMGLVIDPEKQLITSGHATAEYLKREYPGKRIYLFGNPMVKMEFESRGVMIDEEHPDLVVTSFCTSFHYRDLCRLCDLVREGLPYVATHPDYNCPTRTGFIPDIGSLSAYVAASTGRRPSRRT